jgi:outer membrane protein assembly factor BamB
MQIDPKDGHTKKTYEAGGTVRFQPAIMDGRIYLGTQDGKIVCIDTGDRSLTGWHTWGGDNAHSGALH